MTVLLNVSTAWKSICCDYTINRYDQYVFAVLHLQENPLSQTTGITQLSFPHFWTSFCPSVFSAVPCG